MALDPSTLEAIKEWGVTLGAILAAAAAGWKGHARREESKAPHYSGPPDDHPRKISRKEWHENLNHVQAHINKFYILENSILPRLTRDVDSLRDAMERHLSESATAMSTFARLDERIAQYIKVWDEGSQRARHDREEIMERIGGIADRLERMERKA